MEYKDLRQRFDKIPFNYILNGVVVKKFLTRDSIKMKESAYLADFFSRFEKFDIGNSKEYFTELKDFLFMYFCEQNEWLKRDDFETVSEEQLVEVLDTILIEVKKKLKIALLVQKSRNGGVLSKA